MIPDRQQATVGESNINKFKICTCNVRTLAEVGKKLGNVIKEIEKMKINNL